MDGDQILSVLRDGLFTAVVGDVMDTLGLTRQFLPPEIRPLHADLTIAGRAMPVHEADIGPGEEDDAGAFGLMFKALDDLKAGEVYICAGASPTYALWGGLMSTRAQKLGAAGAIMDGYHRDTREITALSFPVFSRGGYAQDQRLRGRVIDFRQPIVFANGCRVAPGDIVFGDIDGVVIIPKDAADEVVRLAVEKATGENTVRRMIEAGRSAEDAFAETGIDVRAQKMEQRTFGPMDVKVPAVGQGTWYFEQAPRDAAVAALRRGLDLGMTHIDTAELYGSGAAEEIVGEATGGRRDEIFLVSKVMPQNASRAGTIAACEKSLRRLKTDRLDCYLLHWRGRHPLADTIAAFEALKRAGKIRSWGVSNFDAGDLDEAEGIAGPGGIACNQVLYHLEERGIEHAVIPWCEKHKVAVVGYSPFGHGRFPRHRALEEVAAARKATPRQVALAFLSRRPSLFAIPKAASAAHAEENAAAGSLILTAAEIAAIDKAFPVGRRGGLAML